MNNKIYLNRNWSYSPDFKNEMTAKDFSAENLQKVDIPHTVAVTPFNDFSTDIYQKVSLYRKTFKTEGAWAGKRVLLTIDAAAHQSEVFFNGVSLALHKCGYTAFTTDLTDHLAAVGEENVLAIKVDSRESVDQPPFGFVIDYMTYGGIYRDVYLDIKNPIFIQDVFVTTNKNQATTKVTLDIPSGQNAAGYTISQKIRPVKEEMKNIVCAEIESGVKGKESQTSASATGIEQWSLENPALYVLTTELKDASGNLVDSKTVRFGFRDIRYDKTGFYLNGKKVKIRGLNRHQAWPYTGYAMPKNMQKEDADILKYKLGLNEVRTSHYPQSQAFVDRCDEIGLLVFTEIPGWQHIGGKEWKDIAVNNVREMVLQYRNHPSIFLWGVRINESLDDDEFYTRTNKLCHDLDPSRPTGGVRYLRNSHLLEDVYTFNDFSHIGTNRGVDYKKNVTKTNKGYMVTEYNGHMYPTKTFDSEAHRTQHAVRHANVIDAVAGSDEHSGSSGWCAFDYNTHKDFGSGDYICYHGVMDMFRNPKLAAAVYKSQADASLVGDVLEVTSSMDIGEYPAGERVDVYILTNADSVKFFVNNIFIKEFNAKENSPYQNLKHGPILIDDYIGHRLVDEDGIKERDNKGMKSILFALQKYGVDKLPFKYKLTGVKLYLKGVTNVQKLHQLYGKYIGNWGGSSISYRFEAYRNGKLVKTLIKTPAKDVRVKAEATRTLLLEDESYDVASVNLMALDENGNVHPYCQEAVTLRSEGPIEIIGPKAVSLKGGLAGTYVKTTGQAGKASLTITDWIGRTSTIEFQVEVKDCVEL